MTHDQHKTRLMTGGLSGTTDTANDEQIINHFEPQADGFLITLTASTYGIVQASFWNIDADTIKTAQDAIIDDLKALVRHGRAQLHHGSYTPQFLPIVWVIGLEGSEPLDFGVMIDAVACDESTIDRRADEIIAKLCRDCQMIGGLV